MAQVQPWRTWQFLVTGPVHWPELLCKGSSCRQWNTTVKLSNVVWIQLSTLPKVLRQVSTWPAGKGCWEVMGPLKDKPSASNATLPFTFISFLPLDCSFSYSGHCSCTHKRESSQRGLATDHKRQWCYWTSYWKIYSAGMILAGPPVGGRTWQVGDRQICCSWRAWV